MPELAFEAWSRGGSFLHRADARFKLLAVLAALVAIGTTPNGRFLSPVAVSLFTLTLAAMVPLPVYRLARRSAAMSLFAVPFAAGIAFSSGPWDALSLTLRVFTSALVILLFIATTPFPAWLSAMRSLRLPPMLVDVTYLVFRYIGLIASQSERMRTAAACRGHLTFAAAPGLLAALFARSLQRAEQSHNALLGRGYSASVPLAPGRPLSRADLLILVTVVLVLAGLRFSESAIK